MNAKNGISRELLYHISQGAFAERLSQNQRKEIHISSELDEFLDEKLEEGKQIILTGNPGDGKTQYIMMEKEEYDGFFLKDGSTWEPSELIEEWNEAYSENRKGILAINDGPLQRLINDFSGDFEFLNDVDHMMENQIVMDDGYEHPNEDIILIDLSKRSVLSTKIVKQAIEKLTTVHDTSEEMDKHISYNAEKLSQEEIKNSLSQMLSYIGVIDSSVTMRDLLNFIAYCINGGKKEEVENFDEDLKFYNLAYEGRGKLFDLFREHIDPKVLTHPYLDSVLWSETEEGMEFNDSDYDAEQVQKEFLRKKRRFLFGDKKVDEIGTKEVYDKTNENFLNYRNNANLQPREKTEQLIQWLNSYFIPESDMTNSLLLWFSHNFRSKENQVIISREEAHTDKFQYKVPKLNSEISDAITFHSNQYVLEYDPGQDFNRKPKMKIDKNLHETLSSLDLGVPYVMRDEKVERKILNFMEEIQKREIGDETRAKIRMKDTETGDITKIKVNNDEFSLSGI